VKFDADKSRDCCCLILFVFFWPVPIFSVFPRTLLLLPPPPKSKMENIKTRERNKPHFV
jgi:hypothetical protein